MVGSDTVISGRQLTPSTGIIAITGELSGAAEDALMGAYAQASGPVTRAIILDCTRLAYMNSSGIGLLVTLLIRMNRQKQRLLCHGLSEHYRQIFNLTRLDEAIGIYASEADALAAAGEEHTTNAR